MDPWGMLIESPWRIIFVLIIGLIGVVIGLSWLIGFLATP